MPYRAFRLPRHCWRCQQVFHASGQFRLVELPVRWLDPPAYARVIPLDDGSYQQIIPQCRDRAACTARVSALDRGAPLPGGPTTRCVRCQRAQPRYQLYRVPNSGAIFPRPTSPSVRIFDGELVRWVPLVYICRDTAACTHAAVPRTQALARQLDPVGVIQGLPHVIPQAVT